MFYKKSFAESVLTIANTIHPQYLVIEPTGVGILSNIIKNLKQIEYERITLLAPVTIVDGKILKETTVMEEVPDSLFLEDIYLTSLEGLIFFVENLIRGHYGSIIRAKGYIKINTLLLRIPALTYHSKSSGRYFHKYLPDDFIFLLFYFCFFHRLIGRNLTAVQFRHSYE